ncbi:MAG: hypothetical protein HKP55_02200 [Gammaproteobacteria bacterium]|nr:DUF4340 domain-containing protein [Gammaproteobacteria bacterium]NNJ90463.1 hypothetical protein [Gammaproteobacteria bacterium]
MSSINRLNLFLLIIIVILAALKFLPKESEYYSLTSVAPDNIKVITISSQQRQLVFKRNDPQWQLESSPEQAIEKQSLSKLLDILKTHSYRQFETTENNLSAFGLNKPLYQLTFDKLVIQFGITDPVQNLRYILLNDKIHLINDRYLQFFLVDEQFFFQKADTEK